MENARYWRAFVERGPRALAANFDGEAGVVRSGGRSLPLVIGSVRRGLAYPCSLYTHYAAYPRGELHLVRPRALATAARAGLGMLGGLLRLARVDRVAQWSGGLLSTDLHPADLADVAPKVTALLLRRFPDHAPLVRCVNGFLDPALPGRLERAGYRLVVSRLIYFFDGRRADFLDRSVLKRDLRALERLPGHVPLGGDELTEADAPRVAELYRKLYLEKHSALNPAYTEEFVRRAIAEKWLDFRGLRHVSGRIDAVYGSFSAAGIFTVPFIGHDTDLGPKSGLYRMLVALLLREAAKRSWSVNYSSAAGEFKRLRGAEPAIEYHAIHTGHLPAARRAAYRALQLLANGPGRRFLEGAGV
jgi:hypothetical protein